MKQSAVAWRCLAAAGLLAALAALPGTALQQSAPERRQLMVAMRDGTRLATDVYLPPGPGPFPAVLARTPYNKDFALGAAPEFARRGYALVAQDTRGRFKSEGDNRPFESDGWLNGRQDGYDTIEWIARQPWSSGRVGTFGGSAVGITQLLAAATNPPHLAGQHIVVAAPSLYDPIVYRAGAFKQNLVEGWLQATRFEPDQLARWRKHSTYDDYWRGQDVTTRWRMVNAPALHVGGWYDIFTQGTIDSFLGYQKRGGPEARGRQRLILGPWSHGVGALKVGQVTFPENAKTPPGGFGDQWRWYDRWLKGIENGIDKEPAVAYYTMGDITTPGAPGCEWRFAQDWPVPARPTAWHLHRGGRLAPEKPRAAEPLAYTSDPASPVPTTGGNHLLLPSGPFDQRPIESRPDVLVFTSDPLNAPLEVTGRVKARLWVSSDARDTDFTAKLCDVHPDGRSLNICDGILRMSHRRQHARPEPLEPGRVYAVEIDLWSTSMVFNRGHRLRVIVASSDHPAYDVNPQTGAPAPADGGRRTARNTLWLDSRRPSHILLPIVGGGRT